MYSIATLTNDKTRETQTKTPIEIALGVDENGMTTARALYEFLGLAPSQFARWSKQNIENNEFYEENSDWVGFDIVSNGNKCRDYRITTDFAKHLSMESHSERGKEARQYFIAVENKAKEYAIKYRTVPKSTIEQGIAVVKFIADDLRVSESSRLFMYENYCKDVGIPTGFLPKYEDNGSRERCSATVLLERNGCEVKTVRFNQLLTEHGYLEIKERQSSTKGIKSYKSLTEKGLKYGVNLISSKNQKETQPYYYADTFMELYYDVV